MSRASRLLDLIHLLSRSRSRTVRELADYFEVSTRTIFRDLAELERVHVPVVSDERGYRLMADATLRPLNLTTREWSILRLALDNPSLRQSSELARRLDLVASKLDAVRRTEVKVARAILADADRSGPMPAAAFAELERAMEEHRSVEIDYVSLRSGRRSWRGVDPWGVFHRGEAWYVVGRCHRADEPRTFRMDRIANLRQLDAHFKPPGEFRIEAFLRNAWSLFHGDEAREIVIHFDSSLAPLIGNARHHEGERMARLPGGAIEYRVMLAHVEEIARWVVTFGGLARAIQPPELVARVAELADGAAEAHREAWHGTEGGDERDRSAASILSLPSQKKRHQVAAKRADKKRRGTHAR